MTSHSSQSFHGTTIWQCVVLFEPSLTFSVTNCNFLPRANCNSLAVKIGHLLQEKLPISSRILDKLVLFGSRWVYSTGRTLPWWLWLLCIIGKGFHCHWHIIGIIILIIDKYLLHLQKGVVHIARVTTAPPPKTEAAVPMPKDYRICRVNQKTTH